MATALTAVGTYINQNKVSPSFMLKYAAAWFTNLSLTWRSETRLRLRPADSVANVSQRMLITCADSEIVSRDDHISIVSYNILAEGNSHPRLAKYYYCNKEHHSWAYRLPLLVEELRLLDADIFGLQEVEPRAFKQLAIVLLEFGYEGRFAPRSGSNEGVATFVRQSRLRTLEHHALDFDALIKAQCDAQGVRADTLKLLSSAGAQMSLLQEVASPHRLLVVGNIHANSIFDRQDRQGLQITLFLRALSALSQQHGNCPMISTGDWNLRPHYATYALIRDGSFPTDSYQTLQSLPLFEGRDVAATLQEFQLNHSLPLKSAYATLLKPEGSEPGFTNYVGCFVSTIDYVWYDSEQLQVQAVLQTPSEDMIQPYVGCPNVSYPSDHISIKTVLAFKASTTER
eukprot:TRINITY_DN794_c0_g1_i1.p1 TRINITY_DN794_c0_g1~~TRINITY_DN794_c0_g1_i1.p1  ORF type:complete len:426 (+),score=67.05 TRINITY_DN794_c0_g1_i1:81-1280(+)